MEKSTVVRVNLTTHDLIGDLATALGVTRKRVVEVAIHAYAITRRSELETRLDAAAERVALAVLHAAAPSDSARSEPASPSDSALAGPASRHAGPSDRALRDPGPPGPPGSRGTATGSALQVDASESAVSRITSALASPKVFATLPIEERFALRRSELEQECDAMGARRPQLVDPHDYGYPRSHGVIAVDLPKSDDPFGASHALLALSARATSLLAGYTHVVERHRPLPAE